MEMQMVKELMLQSLEHEMGGLQGLRDGAEVRRQRGPEGRVGEVPQETEKHVQVLHDACLQLEIDPEEQTPGRKITHDMGASLVAAMEAALGAGDKEQAQCVAGECVVLAETVDHFNWQLIGEVAEKMDRRRRQGAEGGLQGSRGRGGRAPLPLEGLAARAVARGARPQGAAAARGEEASEASAQARGAGAARASAPQGGNRKGVDPFLRLMIT